MEAFPEASYKLLHIGYIFNNPVPFRFALAECDQT